jgi:hypothetical protein
MAVTADAFFVTHGLGKSLTQGDAHVFNGVVAIDVQVAHRVDVQIDQAVTGDLIEHVIEETNAGMQLGRAGAVEIDSNSDLGFSGVASDLGNAIGAVRGRHLLRAFMQKE